MKKQDLLVSLTIDHDFLGKASHCNTFFYLAQCSSIQDDHVILGKLKTPKVKAKAKPAPKGLKVEIVPAEEQDVKESTEKARA